MVKPRFLAAPACRRQARNDKNCVCRQVIPRGRRDAGGTKLAAGREKKPTGLCAALRFSAEEAGEFDSGVRQAGAAAGHKVDVAGHVELSYFHFFHPAALDFPLHAHARHDRHAHPHLHKALNAFDGGHFDGHVESGAIASEKLDDAAPEGGLHNVSDKDLFAKLGDVHFALSCQSMLRGNDQGELIFQDFHGLELGIARHIGNGAKVEAVIEDFVGNVAGKHAMDADLDAGVQFTEFGERREKSVNGAFVDAQRKFAALEAFEFGESLFDLIAEIDEALGVLLQERSCIGEADRPGAADKKRLAEGIFELPHGQADRRLGAVEALSRTRETAFLGNHQKYLEFTQIHGSPPTQYKTALSKVEQR